MPTDVKGEGRGSTRVSTSLRLPAELHERLDEAAEQRGESRNTLIVAAIAQLLDRPELMPVGGGSDIDAALAAAAVGGGSEAIGPLKGIAKHLVNRGEPLLGAVTYSAAATLIDGDSGAAEAAQELVHTGRLVQGAPGGTDVAAALYRRALGLDPTNLEAMNMLGQRRHHDAQRNGDVAAYREAMSLLSDVAAFDNHAKLFLGWSTLQVGRADDETALAEEGRRALGDAMRSWAFGQRDDRERARWLRQLQRLADAGEEGLVEDLRAFANQHARWSDIEPSEVRPSSV